MANQKIYGQRGPMMPFGPIQGGPEYGSPWASPFVRNEAAVGQFQNPWSGFLSQMFGQQQPAPAAPAQKKGLQEMPADIKALTSMSSGPNGKKFDTDGFLGGLFAQTGGKAR